MRAKNMNVGLNKTLFEMKDTNGQTIELRCSDGSHVDVYFNGEVMPYIYDIFSKGEWHTVGLSYYEGEDASSLDPTHLVNFRLYVDGYVQTYSVESNQRLTPMITTLGRKQGSSTYFGGNVEMMLFRNAYCEKETIDSLIDSLDYVSQRKYIDEFNRVNKKEVIRNNTSILSHEYKYKYLDYVTQNRTSYRLEEEKITTSNETPLNLIYHYDNLGRVDQVTYEIGSTWDFLTYEYNDRGFLVDDNGTEIEYYKNGNIKSYGNTLFTYDNKDRLIQVGNTTLTYDTGSFYPNTIGSHELTWDKERLSQYKISGVTYKYKYNLKGLRVRKEVGETLKSRYFYDGDRLVTEIRENQRLDFLYDESNLLYGFILNNTSKYLYIRDALQNIIGIIDESGNLVVKYSYNAFGKILSVTNTSGLSIGEINPFRYKGYYYDSDLQMYIVGERYYNPEFCRFIQPLNVLNISPIDINGINLYVYADNNPVSRGYVNLFDERDFNYLNGFINSEDDYNYIKFIQCKNRLSGLGMLLSYGSSVIDYIDLLRNLNLLGDMPSYLKKTTKLLCVTSFIVESMYDIVLNINNDNLSLEHKILLSVADIAYNSLKYFLVYQAGNLVAKLAVAIGLAVTGLTGVVVAVLIIAVGALFIQTIVEKFDSFWETQKERWIS